MQYLVICLQWLTEMHSAAYILEMHWLMYHSALPLTAGMWMFVILNETSEALYTDVTQEECAWDPLIFLLVKVSPTTINTSNTLLFFSAVPNYID